MARRWLRCRLHSRASYLEFALQSVSMVVTRKISNSQGLTSVEGWKVLLADAAGQGHPHLSGVTTSSFHTTESCVSAEKTAHLFSAHLCRGPTDLVYVESPIPAGDPGPSTGWHFSDPDVQVHFRGLWLALALWAWPPGCSNPRQGLPLCALSWEVSWLHSGWMLQPSSTGIVPENLVLGCTGWPASETTRNRRHLYFSEEKIKNITNIYFFLRCAVVLLQYFKQPLPSTAFSLLYLNFSDTGGIII